MLETVFIDRAMDDLRDFKTLLREFLRPAKAVSAEAMRAAQAKVLRAQKELRGGYNLVDSEWAEIATEDFQMVLDLCSESETELAAHIDEFKDKPEVAEYVQPFFDGQRILRTCARQMRTMLRRRGKSVDKAAQHVHSVVERISTKQQIKIGLMQARDEMKAKAPRELHPEIDRSFRKAIEELED